MKTLKNNEERIIELLTEIRDFGRDNVDRNRQIYAEYLKKSEQRNKKFLATVVIMIILFLALNFFKIF